MKVELISNTNYKDFMSAVNNFIKDKKIIDIKYSAVVITSGNARDGYLQETVDRALILYEEEEK